MPSPFKPKEVTPVQKLAYYWTRLDDTSKGYFEQLYKMHPQDVSEVLAGEALLPAPNCSTLQDWVDGKGGGDALTAFDFSHVTINISEIKAEPEQVDADEKFQIVWAGEAEADFPAREDTVVFMNRESGEEVRNLTVTYPEIKAGAVKEEIECGPLPNGSYVVTLTVNVDGTDPGTELTAQGLRNMAQTTVYVGESDDAWQARLGPVITAMQRQIFIAINGSAGPDRFMRTNAEAIKELAGLAADADRPGRDIGPRTELSSDLNFYGERLSTFPNHGDDELIPAARWAPLRERLQGMQASMSLSSAEDVRKFQERLKAWLDEYSELVRYLN